jgi:hypothetical protein
LVTNYTYKWAYEASQFVSTSFTTSNTADMSSTQTKGIQICYKQPEDDKKKGFASSLRSSFI